MRTSQRGNIIITYPDATCWIYNPQPISIRGASSYSYALIRIGPDNYTHYDIRVALYGGIARVQIERYLQILVTEPWDEVEYRVIFSGNENNPDNLSATSICINGSMSNEQYNFYIDSFPSIRWFTRFPMFINYYSFITGEFARMYRGDNYHDVEFTDCDKTKGHFLRWRDNMGQTWTFLFDEGTEIIKTENGQLISSDLLSTGGFYLQDVKKLSEKSVSRSIKCSAMHLTKMEFLYVKTILSSTLVELYADGGDWLPVIVQDGDWSIKEKDSLKNLEITIRVPEPQMQIN